MPLGQGDREGGVKVQEVEDPVEGEAAEEEEDGEDEEGGGAGGRGPQELVM